MSDTPKRGWLNFSIRDMMFVTVIAAILISWWLDHRYLAGDAQVTREKKARIRDFEAKIRSGFYKGSSSPPGAPVGVSGPLTE